MSEFDVQCFNVTLKSARPGLILHNGLLADPTNPFAMRKASLKERKGAGEEVARQMKLLDMEGSLYVENGEIVIPQHMVKAALYGGAAQVDKMKGKKWANGITVLASAPIIHKGPKDIKELIELEDFQFTKPVVISRSRVMSTRPIFKEWSAIIPIEIETDVLDKEIVKRIFQRTGRSVGFGDWRPQKKGKFGRFTVEKIELVEQEIAEAA